MRLYKAAWCSFQAPLIVLSRRARRPRPHPGQPGRVRSAYRGGQKTWRCKIQIINRTLTRFWPSSHSSTCRVFPCDRHGAMSRSGEVPSCFLRPAGTKCLLRSCSATYRSGRIHLSPRGSHHSSRVKDDWRYVCECARLDPTQRNKPMNTSEKFLRFAAECSLMAELTHNPENKTVWSHMAERWLRCAELVDRQSSEAHYASVVKRHRKPVHRWAH